MQSEEYRAMFELEDRLWWYDGMRAVTASILFRDLAGRQNLRLLDVGCGTGFSLAWLREKVRTDAAFGVDVSPDAALYWQSRGLNTAAIATAHSLPFVSNEFDLVTCFDVIYQLTGNEAKMALSEIRRVLKPGGLLLIREPAYDWMRGAHDLAIGTRHRFTRAEVRRLLSEYGFIARRLTYANTFLFGAAVTHRLLSRIGRQATSDVKPLPRWMNGAFRSALRLEARLLARFTFPFGSSVIALAEKAA